MKNTQVEQGRPPEGVPRTRVVSITVGLLPRQIKRLERHGGNRAEIIRAAIDAYDFRRMG